MKEAIVSKSIIAAGMIIAAFLISSGLRTPKPLDQFQLAVGGNVLYRLEKTTGRVDILIPAAEGAYLIPVWQMSPQTTGKEGMSKDEQEKWGKISVATSQYLRLAQGMPPLQQEAAKETAEKK